MQREEPAARLIDALGDEVGRVDVAESLLVFERVVHLCIGHGARVEPYVDQIGFAVHRLALGRYQDDLIHVGPVEVDVGRRVVLLRHVADLEVLVGIFGHESGGDRLLDLAHQLPDRADALELRVVFRRPHRQRRAPEARTREVPVDQPFEPLAEAARAGRLGFPADGLVEFDHAVAQRRGADEPRVERVVEHRFVGAPAVGVGVGVLLDLEDLVFGLEHDREVDVERRIGVGQLVVVSVLHVAAGVFGVVLRVDVRAHEVGIEVFEQEELALFVDHRLFLAGLVEHEQGRDVRRTRHTGVVGAERRGDVYDARTVGGGHVVARDDAERIAVGFYPRDQLFVADADEFFAAPAFARHFVGALHLLGKVSGNQVAGQDDGLLRLGIGVGAAHLDVFDRGADGQRRIRGQRPGSGRPGQEAERAVVGAEELFARGVAHDAELRRAGRVLHVAVAARLVQLVGRETRAGGRGVGLDGVALVEQSFVEKLLEEPPQRLDIFVVVGNVGVVHVDPVTHLAGQALPYARELHDGLAAGAVVLLDGDLPADVLLGNAEFFLDAQLDGQPVGVPSGFAVDTETLLRLVAAEYVLDGAGHDVVDAGHAVGRGRPLVEDERGVSLARGDAFAESVAGVPFAENLGGQPCQIETFVLLEFHSGIGCFMSVVRQVAKIRRRIRNSQSAIHNFLLRRAIDLRNVRFRGLSGGGCGLPEGCHRGRMTGSPTKKGEPKLSL